MPGNVLKPLRVLAFVIPTAYLEIPLWHPCFTKEETEAQEGAQGRRAEVRRKGQLSLDTDGRYYFLACVASVLGGPRAARESPRGVSENAEVVPSPHILFQYLGAGAPTSVFLLLLLQYLSLFFLSLLF